MSITLKNLKQNMNSENLKSHLESDYLKQQLESQINNNKETQNNINPQINVMFETYIFEKILPLIVDSVIDEGYTYKYAKDTINNFINNFDNYNLMHQYNNRLSPENIPPGIRYPENKEYKGRVVNLVDEYITYYNLITNEKSRTWLINREYKEVDITPVIDKKKADLVINLCNFKRDGEHINSNKIENLLKQAEDFNLGMLNSLYGADILDQEIDYRTTNKPQPVKSIPDILKQVDSYIPEVFNTNYDLINKGKAVFGINLKKKPDNKDADRRNRLTIFLGNEMKKNTGNAVNIIENENKDPKLEDENKDPKLEDENKAFYERLNILLDSYYDYDEDPLSLLKFYIKDIFYKDKNEEEISNFKYKKYIDNVLKSIDDNKDKYIDLEKKSLSELTQYDAIMEKSKNVSTKIKAYILNELNSILEKKYARLYNINSLGNINYNNRIFPEDNFSELENLNESEIESQIKKINATNKKDIKKLKKMINDLKSTQARGGNRKTKRKHKNNKGSTKKKNKTKHRKEKHKHRTRKKH